jgi:hypothetical protein
VNIKRIVSILTLNTENSISNTGKNMNFREFKKNSSSNLDLLGKKKILNEDEELSQKNKYSEHEIKEKKESSVEVKSINGDLLKHPKNLSFSEKRNRQKELDSDVSSQTSQISNLKKKDAISLKTNKSHFNETR